MNEKSEKKKANERRSTNMLKSRKGFGINEIIGIAAGVIIAAVVVIPGLKGFAQSLMADLSVWWDGISTTLFA